MIKHKHGDRYSTAISIIIAGLFIAGAIILTSFYGKNNAENNNLPAENNETNQAFLNAMPISLDDHILGNRDANIKIVTYADPSCPFCMRFKGTMQAILAEYPNQVAWVNRHFPRFEDNTLIATALECAVYIQGEQAFLGFMNEFQLATEAGGDFNASQIAEAMEIDNTVFTNCINSDKFAEKIARHRSNALDSGLQGVPYSIVFVGDSPVGIIDGAESVENVRAIIAPHL